MNKTVVFTSVILIIIAVLLICCVAPEYPCSESCVGCQSIEEYIRDSWATYAGYIILTFVIAWTVCTDHTGDKKHGKKEEEM